MTRFQTNLVLSAIFLIVCCVSTVQAASTGQDVIDWFKTKPGAMISDKIAYQEKDGAFQMVATADVPKDTQLMVVPASATVGTLEDDICATVQTMIDERSKGKDSDYFTYMDYLFGDEQKSRSLPSGWSKEGQQLLKYVLGRHLLPDEATEYSVRVCRKALEKNENDPNLEQQAYFLITSHTSDDVMIPGVC